MLSAVKRLLTELARDKQFDSTSDQELWNQYWALRVRHMTAFLYGDEFKRELQLRRLMESELDRRSISTSLGECYMVFASMSAAPPYLVTQMTEMYEVFDLYNMNNSRKSDD
jgi:hypothetical protein